jgi:hypothetical protein
MDGSILSISYNGQTWSVASPIAPEAKRRSKQDACSTVQFEAFKAGLLLTAAFAGAVANGVLLIDPLTFGLGVFFGAIAVAALLATIADFAAKLQEEILVCSQNPGISLSPYSGGPSSPPGYGDSNFPSDDPYSTGLKDRPQSYESPSPGDGGGDGGTPTKLQCG